ncbi:Peptidoglycan/LPS O-acetylase OafA/YrhL, contains acyltransferase and SGNH-hydrolase domains [Lachnospiraceae bacterium]|nr:Peptidoglycan/LPS O-acetylase OafA/YrhL, contains acyltransferase and SGNH-hydrolase domains [Lachnospiraceae bacterium]
MNNPVSRRNSMVDILKGLGIIVIIITHFRWEDSERLKYLFPFWVDQAVPVFMIISGYVYAMSYGRNNIKTLSSGYRFDFVVNKIIRYTIPFLMAYLIEVIVFMITKSDLSINYFAVRFIRGGVGPGSYYYPVMIQFIFTFPFIYFIVKKFDYAGIIICFVINGVYEILQRCFMFSEDNYRLLVFRYIFLMSVGCYLYLGKTKPKTIWKIVGMIVGMLWLIGFKYMGYQPKVIIYWSGTCMLAALWTAPVVDFLLRNEKISQMRCKPLEEVGKASYNIFLTQMVFYASARSIVNKIPHRALSLIFCIGVNVIVGLIFYKIESKITKAFSAYVKNKDYYKKDILNGINFIQKVSAK